MLKNSDPQERRALVGRNRQSLFGRASRLSYGIITHKITVPGILGAIEIFRQLILSARGCRCCRHSDGLFGAVRPDLAIPVLATHYSLASGEVRILLSGLLSEPP